MMAFVQLRPNRDPNSSEEFYKGMWSRSCYIDTKYEGLERDKLQIIMNNS